MAKENYLKIDKTDAGDVLILNKAFEGSWNDEEGNISHEIIDFFKTDEGDYYVYNSPYGSCREGIYVNDKDNIMKKEKKCKYLIIASSANIIKHDDKKNGSEFKINYVIELEERVTELGMTDKFDKKNNYVEKSDLRKNYEELVKNIRYGGRCLSEIFNYDNDNSLVPLVTFKAKAIYYQPDKLVTIKIEKDFDYHRNRTYVYNDTDSVVFNTIVDAINENEFIEFSLKSIDPEDVKTHQKNTKKTFLDFILKTNAEECYTNILQSVFDYNNAEIFKRFLIYLKENDEKFSKYLNRPDNEIKLENYFEKLTKVEREKFVNNEKGAGRMDISAETEDIGIFIENKVLSGLNGLKKSSNKKEEDKDNDINDMKYSQLTVYYEWAKDNKRKSIGLILVPDYKVDDIKKELEHYEKDNRENYVIIKYSQIKDFFHLDEIKSLLKNGFVFNAYADELEYIFGKHSYSSKQEKFKQDFLQAISEAKVKNEELN